LRLLLPPRRVPGPGLPGPRLVPPPGPRLGSALAAGLLPGELAGDGRGWVPRRPPARSLGSRRPSQSGDRGAAEGVPRPRAALPLSRAPPGPPLPAALLVALGRRQDGLL